MFIGEWSRHARSQFMLSILISGLVVAFPAIGQELQQGVLTINGANLKFVAQGNGEPVLLPPPSLVDLRIWEPQREAIVDAGYQYISYNPRYFGTDPWPDQGEYFSVPDAADELVAVVESLGKGPVHLVTWSRSGQFGAIALVKRPDLFKTITVFEAGLSSMINDTEAGKAAEAERTAAAAGAAKPFLEANDLEGAARMFIEGTWRLEPGGFAQLSPDVRQIHLDNARTLTLKATKPATVTCEMLGGVTVPTLIINGDKGWPAHRMIADRMAECIPNAQRATLAGVSHGATIQDPDAFNILVLDFIRAHGG